MFTYTCGKMLGGFADIAGITVRTYKLIYHTRKEPTRDKIFHTKDVANFKGRENQLTINTVAITFGKVMNLFLRDDLDRTNVR